MDVSTDVPASTYSIAAALGERERAHEKHGPNSIEGSLDPLTFLALLVEEVGEVAHALTYDAEHPEELRQEVSQVMAVAWAWLDSLARAEAGR